MSSENKKKGKEPAAKIPEEEFCTDYTMPGVFPTFLEDSIAGRIKFGAFLPLSPTSPGRNLAPPSSIIASPEKSEVGKDIPSVPANSSPTSPAHSSAGSPTPSSSLSSAKKDADHGIETSDWYCPELWSRQKALDQETKASKLIGDFNRIKATLEYYCANDLQYHSKWVRILADHILLVAEAKGQHLNIAVAYHVSQLKASKYRQHLEASLWESECKRAYEEELEKNRQGSLRGKSKVPRTDDASISKGTHPMSKKGSARNSLPEDMAQEKSKDKEINFKLVGPDDFIKTLKMPKATEVEYVESFRQLRGDIFQSLRSPGKPYDPLFFMRKFDDEVDTDLRTVVPFDGQKIQLPAQPPPAEPIENIEAEGVIEDYDLMEIDTPKIPGYLNTNEKCTMQ
ncbi:hypothetical protein TWF718_010420 [Orbilia javanica]|uniref:Uncharacterized protein n=1 Tax=Orbilia javanica TaxID=47235 RepID=A0AAN8RB24_9PEZI